ncbi:cation diffusion facilitator family transporter [Arthrobacter sp.]|uniref:cation diffusion facilitator family transporter n=1 Tax=Arthrobacter sp. TaxID=1667 RepID=UPI003A8F7CF4
MKSRTGHDHDDRGHSHDHQHDGHDHGHNDDHPHDGRGHHHDHDQGGHGHEHPSGLRGVIHGLFVPHSHDVSDSIDDAMQSSAKGIRAVKLSLIGLGATAVFQLVVVLVSGSVALLADTVHNFSDALTAIPLWIAFLLGRRAATRRFTFGYGRAEDMAGLFIVAMIALSAVVAAVESIRRFFEPQPLENLGWVLAAGLIGFAGNEAVAIYRIRVGRQIGSAALVADGVHARTDGFTSLAVVLGVAGVWLGFPLADPIIGLLISAAIAVLLWGTARDIGRRLMDGVDPDLVQRAETAVTAITPGEPGVRMRWMGHKLHVEVSLPADGSSTMPHMIERSRSVEKALRSALPNVGSVTTIPVWDTSAEPSPA